MAEEDALPPCHNRIRPEEFRPARHHELDQLRPCGFCFPDGEVDVDQDDLLVASISAPRAFHRHPRSGALEWTGEGTDQTQLANALEQDNVTDPADIDVDQLLGGGA